MSEDFTDKTVLVTGGNSGIGRGIAHRFARAGAHVIIVARDVQKGTAVVAELGKQRAEFHSTDLSSEDNVVQLVNKLEEKFHHLDVVVNNAGSGSRRGGVTSDDGPGERWDKMRGANLDAAYFVSAHALPLLARAASGAIVNISSTATLHGNWGTYCIAKAGIEAVTRAFAAEGAEIGVRANCVSPGWIATEKDEELPASGAGEWEVPPSLLNRMGTPDEIAAAVCFLASHDASFITGQTLIVDGGLTVTDYPSLSMLERVGDRLKSR
ncbi:MAG: SDR family oxidoreductase [Gammaproteobacteria bacterium]|nr:SDR family oxidoreductase [Gammaproteobacteria bacterium]